MESCKVWDWSRSRDIASRKQWNFVDWVSFSTFFYWMNETKFCLKPITIWQYIKRNIQNSLKTWDAPSATNKSPMQYHLPGPISADLERCVCRLWCNADRCLYYFDGEWVVVFSDFSPSVARPRTRRTTAIIEKKAKGCRSCLIALAAIP